MQMYHSDVDTFRKSVGSARKRPISNRNCRRSIPFRDVLILYISQESQDRDHGLHVEFECFNLALWPTLTQKFMNFWSFLTRPGDKHDEKISNCSSTPKLVQAHDSDASLTIILFLFFIFYYFATHNELQAE